jgi:RNA polymerase sigma-70 factor, ECF subfamily
VSSTAREDPLERLTTILQRERSALVGVARAEGLAPEDAVDCVQEAALAFMVLERRGQLPVEQDRWAPWLATMVRNTARNGRRLHHRSKPHGSPAIVDAIVDPLPPTDELVGRAEDVVRLRGCVAELCEIQKAVVMLRLFEEQSGEDVAQALGVSRGYVDVLVHRARASLRTCMAVSPCRPG